MEAVLERHGILGEHERVHVVAERYGGVAQLADAVVVVDAGLVAADEHLVRKGGGIQIQVQHGNLELTDERGGERLDRIAVVEGEIRIADRAYLQPDRMASVLEGGADLLVRANWKNARWLDAEGAPVDLIAELRKGAASGLIDRPILVGRKRGKPLALRLVAVRKPPAAAEEARAKARREARRRQSQIAPETLVAAEWVLLVTSLDPEAFPAADVLALYRLRWRIELAFKRLKSLIGLKGPPGKDERSARPWLLAHLLLILLLEPLVDAFGDSPHWAQAG